MKKDCKLYILQLQTYTLPARLIKLATQYDYSHIAISFDRDCNITYSFGRKKYNSFIDCGFVEEHKNGKFFEKFKNTKCRIYELSITKKQLKRIKKKIKYFKNHSELFKYDFLGIFLRFFRLPVSFKNKYVCSYFVAKLLEDSEIYRFNKSSYFIEPKDFEKMSDIKEIYSGQFLLYK